MIATWIWIRGSDLASVSSQLPWLLLHGEESTAKGETKSALPNLARHSVLTGLCKNQIYEQIAIARRWQCRLMERGTSNYRVKVRVIRRRKRWWYSRDMGKAVPTSGFRYRGQLKEEVTLLDLTDQAFRVSTHANSEENMLGLGLGRISEQLIESLVYLAVLGEGVVLSFQGLVRSFIGIGCGIYAIVNVFGAGIADRSMPGAL
ncbi:hypothetical protein TruAng_002870 [Truncatella angustata]|nr:hypothetical protein TruAng_002870 [Truncatella angustata]